MAYNMVNKNVKIMQEINITGNIVPNIWYKKLVTQNGKPNLPAILILSDIIYWYRPTEIRSEQTGEFLKYQQKFKADKLQKSYKDYMDFFGFGKAQVRNAINYLAEKGLITKEFRKIIISGQTLNNVLYLDIIPENIKKLTYEIYPVNIDVNRGSFESEEAVNIDVKTNTKTTTEITTKNTKNIYTHHLKNGADFYKTRSGLFEHIEEVYRNITTEYDEYELEKIKMNLHIFYEQLKERKGIKHSRLTKEQMTNVIYNIIEHTAISDDEIITDMINGYFDEKQQYYSMQQFFSDDSLEIYTKRYM